VPLLLYNQLQNHIGTIPTSGYGVKTNDRASENECLRFYANPRGVQTASAGQVRQPIFSESVDHWRHFEPWLGPLQEALVDLRHSRFDQVEV
jgi:hypothetical protein